ncbi:MAG: hypothetical protein ACOC5F_04430 [Candidatus Aminicenantaceae bacterium]
MACIKNCFILDYPFKDKNILIKKEDPQRNGNQYSQYKGGKALFISLFLLITKSTLRELILVQLFFTLSMIFDVFHFTVLCLPWGLNHNHHSSSATSIYE